MKYYPKISYLIVVSITAVVIAAITYVSFCTIMSKVNPFNKSVHSVGLTLTLLWTYITKFKTVCSEHIEQRNNQTFRFIYPNYGGLYSLFNIKYARIIGTVLGSN